MLQSRVRIDYAFMLDAGTFNLNLNKKVSRTFSNSIDINC